MPEGMEGFQMPPDMPGGGAAVPHTNMPGYWPNAFPPPDSATFNERFGAAAPPPSMGGGDAIPHTGSGAGWGATHMPNGIQVEPGTGVGAGQTPSQQSGGEPQGQLPETKLAPSGKPPEAVIWHHTAGRGTPQGVVSWWRQQRRGLGSQYIIDRDGRIWDTKKELGWDRTSHMLPGWGREGRGLSNQNTVGVEIIANNDKDVTDAQRAAAARLSTLYPNARNLGHGQVNPGHRQSDEGFAALRSIQAQRARRGLATTPVPPSSTAPEARHPFLGGPARATEPVPDRSSLDNTMGNEVAQSVTGNANVRVKVDGQPRGSAGEGHGLFKRVVVNRYHQMEYASSSHETAEAAH